MLISLNDNLKNKCLVATPNTKDELFSNSVIYITEHSNLSGAVGVMINRNISPSSHRYTHIKPQIDAYDWANLPLYFGGPVELHNGFVLHQNVDDNKLSLSNSLPKISKLINQKQTKPLMLTAGYCMWESLQLEHELRFNNWLVLHNAAEYLLNSVKTQERYNVALNLAGIKNIALFDSNSVGHA